MNAAVNQFQKSINNWKRYLKSLKKQNKMLYITAKHSSLCHELKNINNICDKVSKKNNHIAEIDLSVIMIPYYKVTVIDLKQDKLLNKII